MELKTVNNNSNNNNNNKLLASGKYLRIFKTFDGQTFNI